MRLYYNLKIIVHVFFLVGIFKSKICFRQNDLYKASSKARGHI